MYRNVKIVENEFFGRREAKEIELIDRQSFNSIMGFCLFFGFVVNALEVVYLRDFVIGLNPIVFLLGYFASAFFGIWLSKESDIPAISFMGYCFVVLPVGLVLSVSVPEYSFSSVKNAIVLTTVVTGLMCFASIIYPEFFKGLGRTLFFSLLALIVVEFVCILLGFFQIFRILDVVVAGIFCLYIGYDYYRSQQVPSTVDNAIDCCVGLYLDIINLFLRILRLIGRRK